MDCMQTDERSQKHTFSSYLKEQYLSMAHDQMKGFRDRAWDHFLELGLPERKQEAFQYVPLRQLYQHNWVNAPKGILEERDLSIYPECKQSYLVFVNGEYRPDLSNLTALPRQVVVLPLDQAMTTYASFLQSRLAKGLKEELDPFSALNGALHLKGVFVFVPPKIEVQCPLQCVHLVTPNEEGLALISPRVHVLVGSHAKLQWITTHGSTSSHPVLLNAMTDVALEEEASFHMTHVSCPHPEAWQFDAFRATLKRNSRLQSISFTSGAKTVREDYRVSLIGEGSTADLKGVWMLSERNQAHVHVAMDHGAPHTESMQHFKGIAGDAGQSSFEGKIHVHPIAQKTQAYQLNNNIILGHRAIANCKPNLEIFADDVKASHGATIARLDLAQLFYIQSRGLSEEQAKGLLILGFCKEVLDQIPHPSIREETIAYAEAYFKDR